MDLNNAVKRYHGKKIGVLMGGLSSEREISLRSGENVYNSLTRMGLNPVKIDVGPTLTGDLIKSQIDIAFNVLHGKFGEDGAIQGLLEIMGIPYTGSGILGSAIGMDKLITKKLLAQNGIPVPDFIPINTNDPFQTLESIQSKIGFPFVLKPNTEGSSIGISLIKDNKDFDRLIQKHIKQYPSSYAEKYIRGKEITIGVVGNSREIKILPILGLKPKNEFYDFEAKYTKDLTEFELPAKISAEKENLIRHYAQIAFKEMRLSGVARFDAMLDEDENPYFLEVNTIPGMTETSDIPAMAHAAGCYDEVMIGILNSSIK